MNTIIIEKKGKYDREGEKELKGFGFALKARDPKDSRETLRRVLIDDGLVVCTDGSRLHIFATNLEIESGCYKVITQKSSQIVLQKDDCAYPDYKKVIPVPKWKSTISCHGSHHSLFHEVYKNYADDVASYNTDYLHDAYMDNSSVSLYKNERSLSPLVMYDNDSRAAIVMPLKNNEKCN
jgi:hypothetical protein